MDTARLGEVPVEDFVNRFYCLCHVDNRSRGRSIQFKVQHSIGVGMEFFFKHYQQERK